MSIDNLIPIDNNAYPAAPYQIYLTQNLTATEQEIAITHLPLLPAECVKKVQKLDSSAISLTDSGVIIKQVVDGRSLACPMPLLKTKVALRNIAINEALYIIATDPNSQADIVAFCQQNWQNKDSSCLQLLVNQSTVKANQSSTDESDTASFDTIFHFIITKTDSN
ncbi:MAG: sulfurtransferase TusA family protein [Psychrobacter sp.]|nr:sulfurtransferase TusA family protein [Psychrobacter sp.]